MILSLTHVKYNTVTNKKRKTSASWKHFNAFNNLFLFPTQLMDWVRISLTFSKPWIGPWGRISAPFLPFRGVHGMLELLIYSSFGTSLIEQQDPFGEHDTTHQDTEHMLQLRTAQLQFCAPCALHCAIRIGVVVVFQDIPMANYKHKSFVYTLFWCTFRIVRCWHCFWIKSCSAAHMKHLH